MAEYFLKKRAKPVRILEYFCDFTVKRMSGGQGSGVSRRKGKPQTIGQLVMLSCAGTLTTAAAEF
jgi:hypothetical protein